MSNYELYEHKKSDTVKWVLTLIAFIIVGVLIAGLIAGWFDKQEDSPAAVTEQTTAIDGGMSVTPSAANGIRLMAAERTATDVSPLAAQGRMQIGLLHGQTAVLRGRPARLLRIM